MRGEYRIVARGADALTAAAAKAKELGYRPHIIECEGEARDVAREHAAFAARSPSGTALISGGELTVTVRGSGSGGPNQEYALAAGLALAGMQGLAGLAGDTDGIDGNNDAAGAFFDGAIPDGAAEALEANDSGTFFARHGGLFVTGPTGTNVNDLRIILTAP